MFLSRFVVLSVCLCVVTRSEIQTTSRRNQQKTENIFRRHGFNEEETEWLSERSTNASSRTELPGLKTRITQKGLDFASDLAMNVLMHELKHLTIPDVNNKVGPVDVKVSNIRVESFPRPNSNVQPIPFPGYGIRWTATNLNPVIKADYTAKLRTWLGTLTKRGTGTFRGRRLHFVLDFNIGRGPGGRPETEISTCSCQGDVSIDFSGQWSDILNVGSDIFESRIEKLVTSQICFQAKKEINSKLGQELRKIPLTHVVADEYLLDFSLVTAPSIQQDAIEIKQKGAVYVADNPQEPPFSPPELPIRHGDDDRMVYVYLTDYIINSAAFAAFQNGILRYTVTPEMVPDEHRDYLNTTCTNAICLGTIFEQLPQLYPGAVASLEVQATSPPHLDVLGSSFNVSVSGRADVFVMRNDSRKNLFSIGLNISGSFNTSIIGKRVYIGVGDITVDSPSAEVVDSSIGDVGSGFFFESILRVISQQVIIPKIKEHGDKGILIPKVNGVEFIEPIVVEGDTTGVFIVGTDFNYEVPKKKRSNTRRTFRRRYKARG